MDSSTEEVHDKFNYLRYIPCNLTIHPMRQNNTSFVQVDIDQEGMDYIYNQFKATCSELQKYSDEQVVYAGEDVIAECESFYTDDRIHNEVTGVADGEYRGYIQGNTFMKYKILDDKLHVFYIDIIHADIELDRELTLLN